MTKEELEIAKAACCVGTMWNEYEGKEQFDRMVGLRVRHLIGLVKDCMLSEQANSKNKE